MPSLGFKKSNREILLPLPPSVQFLRYFDFIVCGGELDSPGGGQGRDLEAACRISDGRPDPVKW